MQRSVIIFCFFIFLGYTQLEIRPAASQSEPDTLRYVSDVLVINIKDQLEKPYSVIGVVRSGDPVHIIEEQENYYRIETVDNKQGWIAKQYLKKELPDSLVAQQLRQEVLELKKQLVASPITHTNTEPATENAATSCSNLQQQLKDAEKQILQLQEEKEQKQSTIQNILPENVTELQEQHIDITKQLEQTSQRYNQLVVEFEKRGKEIANLQNSLAKKDDLTRFFWFGVGAVVFFLGLLAGKSSGRKKNKLIY